MKEQLKRPQFQIAVNCQLYIGNETNLCNEGFAFRVVILKKYLYTWN